MEEEDKALKDQDKKNLRVKDEVAKTRWSEFGF
jgi:hypothetical protein